MDATHVVMFPGVGAEYGQMVPRYVKAYPEDRQVLKDWGDLTGVELGGAVHPDASERERTRQLEVHALNLLWWRRKAGEFPRPAVCGHSLGYYAALVAAGVIDEETSLRLVNEVILGSWRHPAVSDGDKFIFSITTRKEYPFDAALACVGAEVIGENSLRQRIMYGARRQYEQIVGHLNGSLLAAPILQTRIPFHSREMYPLQGELAARIDKLAIKPADPSLPLWSHLDGHRIFSGTDAMRLVTEQSFRCVHWMRLVDGLVQAGRFDFIEVGPNRILSQIVRLISPFLCVRFVDRLRGCAAPA